MAKRGYRGGHPHDDMKVSENPSSDKYSAKLTTEYNKLAPKQKYSYIRTNYFYPQATATITVADGDAASGMAEKESLVITATDGAIGTYVICDDDKTTVATGDVLAAGSDTGTSTAGAGLAGGIAVTIDLTGTPVTQNAFLVQLKAAIEHANSPLKNKVTVSAVPVQANGNQAITLTQVEPGPNGNVTITDDIDQTTIVGFTGG